MLSESKRGKREFLDEARTRGLLEQLNAFFESIVEISRNKVGKRKTVEILIEEEAFLLLTKFIGGRYGWQEDRLSSELESSLAKMS